MRGLRRLYSSAARQSVLSGGGGGDDTLMNAGPPFSICIVWSFWGCLFYERQQPVVRCMCIFFHVMDRLRKALVLPGRAGALLGYPSFLLGRSKIRGIALSFPSLLLSLLHSFYWNFDIFYLSVLLVIRSFSFWRLAPGTRYQSQCNMQFCQRIKVGRCEQQPLPAME